MFSKMYPQILKNNKESQQSKETQERRIRKEQYDLISKYTMKLQWLKLYGNISRTDGSSGKINLCVEPIDLDKDTQTYERTGSSIYSIKKMENNKPGSILTPYEIMCSKSWWGGSVGKVPAVKPDNLNSISRTREHLPLWVIFWPPHMACTACVRKSAHSYT